MYLVNKKEAMMLREMFGSGISLYRTCKQKTQRHHYLCSEEEYGKRLVEDMRGGMSDQDIRRKYTGSRRPYQRKSEFEF